MVPRLRRYAVSLLGWALLLCGLSTSAQYMDNFTLERRFVHRLLAPPVELYDLAEYQIELMATEFPKAKEAVDVLYSELYLATNQRRKALDVLAKVPRTSRFYPDACRLRAKHATSAAERATAYTEYFATVKEPPQDPEEIEEFTKDVLTYYRTLIQEGKAQQAKKVLALLNKLPEDQQFNPNMIKFLGAQAILEGADADIEAGKPVAPHKKAIEKAKADLQNLIWSMDYPAAMAYGEMAHAMVLLGQYDEAIKTVDQATNFLKTMEEVVKKETGGLGSSPVAPGLYYIAEAKYEKAKAIRNKQRNKAKELLVDAVKKFYLIAKSYNGAPVHRKAVVRVGRLKEVLKKVFDTEVKLDEGEEQAAKYQMAVDAYQRGDVAKAGNLFLQTAAINLKGPKSAESLKFAVVCMYKTKHYLEAMALADFLKDWYPQSEETHTALFNLGVTLIKDVKGKSPAQAASMTEDAMIVLTAFVFAAPQHPKAPWAAYRVGGYRYDHGSELRKEKNELVARKASVAEVNAKIEEMRKAYLEAAPVYEFLTERYPSSEYGIKAYHKLGWIYHIAGDSEKSAANFLRFCELEEKPVEEKVEAKYFAAEHLRQAGKLDDAVAQFKELMRWTAKGSDFPQTDRVKSYRQNAEGMISWINDEKYRKLLGEIGEIDARLNPPEGEPAKQEPPPAGRDEAQKDPLAGLTPAQLQARRKELQTQAKALLATTISGFQAVIAKYPKADQTPANIAKLGSLYLEQEDFENAVKWLERLSLDFPDTDPAKEGLFNLGRAYVENGQWEKASSTFEKLVSRFDELPAPNLAFIGGKLYQDKPNEDKPGIDPKIVLAANLELLRRSENRSHPDYAELQPQRERALFRAGESYVLLKQPENAVEQFDRLLAENKAANQERERQGQPPRESPYYYDILFLKGDAFRLTEQYAKSQRAFDEILTYLNPEKNQGMYYRAVYESGQALMLMDNLQSVKKAAARFQQIVTFADSSVAEVAPWVEKAYLGAARAFALIGDAETANQLRDDYRRKFPGGMYTKEILTLPSPKFRTAPPSGE